MKLYHLSVSDHGSSFVFKPRIPNNGFIDDAGNLIEDISTPRVCFSRTIQGAIKAIQIGLNKQDMYIYMVETDDFFIPNQKKPHHKYGPCFRHHLLKVDHTVTWFNRCKPLHREMDPYRGCVPDAKKTKEVWILKEIKARRVGMIETYESGGKTKYRKYNE